MEAEKLEKVLEKAEAAEKESRIAMEALEAIKKRAKNLEALMLQALSSGDFSSYQKLRDEQNEMPDKVRECLQTIDATPDVRKQLAEAWKAYKEDVAKKRRETAAELDRIIKEYSGKLLPDLALLNEQNGFYNRIFPILQDDTERPAATVEQAVTKSLLANALKAAGYTTSEALAIYAMICHGHGVNLQESLENIGQGPALLFDWNYLLGSIW